ncbi:hypothetical protein C206_00785 [Pseudomonas putida TRO1]|uniref:Uncharacterized protein n=1 Tax=Pseudomonas putida TRO1 TaxID=1227924 RepID=A0AAD2ZVB5_PSEPU|nr:MULTISPECIES: hypothetical protein [Pseudomonas]ENY79650.1 hypothetical protein C206_00785 [Pseudomonas putida TRO1]
MDTNKMREQASNEFDAWLDGYEKDRGANGWMPLEPYVRKHMRNAFVASREAVVVELPEAHMNGSYTDPQVLYAEEVRQAIEAQGLKVTP